MTPIKMIKTFTEVDQAAMNRARKLIVVLNDGKTVVVEHYGVMTHFIHTGETYIYAKDISSVYIVESTVFPNIELA